MVQKQKFNINFSRIFYAFFCITILTTLGSNPVLAQTISTIGENMITNTNLMPRLLTGIAYLIGVVFGVYGIIKTKDHVENPNQTALRYPVISFLIGGSMFALPIVYESMASLIQPDFTVDFDPEDGGAITAVSDLLGGLLGAAPIQAFSQILDNIIESLEEIPGLITGIAYMLGLVLGIAGLLKIKEHVEEPSRTPMREGVIRLIVGGMLFSIPTVYAAMMNMISQSSDDGGIAGAIGSVLSGGYIAATSGGLTGEAPGAGCIGDAVGNIINTLGGGSGFGLGSVICNLFMSTTPFLAFLTAIAYLFGLIVGLWGILKIKDHVERPEQTTVWDPVAKLVVAGGFFSLPYMIGVAYSTVAALIVPHSNSLGGEVRVSDGGAAGLDTMIAALVNDTFMPMSLIINWFALIAGFILVFIGISRLMKSAQEGARGPGGIGTIMTFITGGTLLAFGPMITSLSTSLFAADGIATPNVGTLRYTAGMEDDAIARAHTVIDAIILFVMMIGFVSVARGIFIMRGVAEGSSQASSMAGITHLIGGALAINLAPFLNAVQNTLGITDLGLGIGFGGGGGGGLLGLIGGFF